MTSDTSLLADRGVLWVGGPDAADLLNRLFTNSMLGMRGGEARYAGFLSPQGKLLFDFLVVAADDPPGGFYLDGPAAQAADLAKRLNFQKLRAKVVIEDRSGTLAVAAAWGGRPPQVEGGLVYRDPRAAEMGYRVIAAPAAIARFAAPNEAAFEAHRIRLGVPNGGVDFAYGEVFAHEADLDHFNGVDFKKGCYVGQEIVARVHFRKTARKRLVPVRFDGPVPAPGCEITAGAASIGHVGSVVGSIGLAMVRLDRLAEAEVAGTPLRAGDAAIHADVPAAFADAAALDKVVP